MRVLFVKLSSIGDIVHTLPALAAVKRAFPDAVVHWVAEKRSAEILRDNPILDRLVEIDTRSMRRGRSIFGRASDSALGQLREVRASAPDLSIDFQGLFKSAAVAKISGAPRRFGFDRANLREPASAFLLTDRIEVEPFQNVILKNLELAERSLREYTGDAGLVLDRTLMEFPIAASAEDVREAKAAAEKAGGPFAILNPGGGWVTKLWRPEDYGKLADRLRAETGLSPVVVSGPGEEALAAAVEAASRSGILHARLGLKSFFELAKRASVYVGGDTGPTHLAVAAGCPVVGIFGPTEWWRNGSPLGADICVSREGLECRVDCHRRTCGKWVCMDIPVEKVLDAVKMRLEAASAMHRGAR